MRIVCWQTILMKYHALFFRKSGKVSQILSSGAVVIGAIRVKVHEKKRALGNCGQCISRLASASAKS